MNFEVLFIEGYAADWIVLVYQREEKFYRSVIGVLYKNSYHKQ